MTLFFKAAWGHFFGHSSDAVPEGANRDAAGEVDSRRPLISTGDFRLGNDVDARQCFEALLTSAGIASQDHGEMATGVRFIVYAAPLRLPVADVAALLPFCTSYRIKEDSASAKSWVAAPNLDHATVLSMSFDWTQFSVESRD